MLFLSYCGEDAKAAAALAVGLRARGLDVFCAAAERGAIPAGASWSRVLEEQLAKCSGLAVLVGGSPLDGWVEMEVAYSLDRRARDAEKRFFIAPLLLPGQGPKALRGFLGLFQATPLPEHWDRAGPEEFARIAAALPALNRAGSAAPADAKPFPGLECFDREREAYFFGRASEVRELCLRFGQLPDGFRRWVHVQGASGSGKSSLLRAGLVPAVERGWLRTRCAHWRTAVMRPGRQPVRALATAVAKAFETREGTPGFAAAYQQIADGGERGLDTFLRGRLADGAALFLALDQLEEAFLAEAEAAALDLQLAAALERSDGFFLTTAIRNDFVHRLGDRMPRLSALLNARASIYSLAPLAREALPLVVRGPAAAAGWSWQPNLAERLLGELRQEVGGAAAPSAPPADELPLLAHVLAQLFEKASKRVAAAPQASRVYELREEDYDQLGSIRAALSASADGLLRDLGAENSKLAFDLLLRLVRPGRGEADRRQSIARTEALQALGGGEAAEELLRRLSGAVDPEGGRDALAPLRLVYADGGEVHLIHEVLLRAWEALRLRVDAERERLELRDSLNRRAEEWDRHGRSAEFLPGAGQLALYERVRDPGPLAAPFLGAARRRVRRARWLRRAAVGGLALLAVLAGGFAFQAERERQKRQPELDRFELASLETESTGLAAGGAPSLAATEAWLRRANEVVSREAEYRARLGTLEARQHTRPAEGSERQVLRDLLSAIDRARSVDGALTRVQRMRERSEGPRLPDDLGQRRDDVHLRVARDPCFESLEGRLRVPDDFVPLGPDPGSGLEEFAQAGTGSIPVRAEGKLQLDGVSAIVFVLLPPGEFLMGPSPGERTPVDSPPDPSPQRSEAVAAFFLAKTELTVGAWAWLVGLPLEAGDEALLPVVEVTWSEARARCAGSGNRLPSEVEWEYACRAGTTTQWPSGEAKESLLGDSTRLPAAWFLENSENRRHAVGTTRANGFGLLDMTGNVGEWSEDVSKEDAGGRVIRSGAFNSPDLGVSAAYHGFGLVGLRWVNVGFRPARSITTG